MDLEVKRRLLGLTIQEVADQSGVSYPKVWRALRSQLQKNDIVKIETALFRAEREQGIFLNDQLLDQ